MNYSGPWSWRASKQGTPVLSDEERAYAEKVRANKKKAGDRARTQRQTAMRRHAKQRNDAPIY